MSDLQGLATFPGVNQLIDASITLGHGISPSSATLTIAPQPEFNTEVGTLVFTFGGVSIALVDCRVDYGSIERTASGEVCRLSVLDRRWRWQFGQISGKYNSWRDNFSLESGESGSIDTERTPQELAALCLEAMGETDFDVSELPNDTRPSAEWNYAVPAMALDALCDELGCRVVLGIDNRVSIRRVGQGAELPGGSFLEDAGTVDLPNRPDTIAVVGGANRYQVDFQLEAVGLEEGDARSADTLRPVNELGYRPAAGWTQVDLPFFHQVDARFRALAQASVFKYYRIQAPLDVPGYEGPQGSLVTRLEQILPIENEQIAVAAENGQVSNRPASVFGVWFPDGDSMANTATALVPAPEQSQGDGGDSLATLYKGRYTIDTARGLVIFNEPVYRNTHPSATGASGYELEIGPAQLVLRAACRVRDANTLEVKRYVRQRSTGSSLGTQPRFLKHEEIVKTHIPQYAEDYSIIGVQTNAAEVDPAADYYLDAAMEQYEVSEPRTARYAGLVPINPDGAIQQVSFHVGAGGATTSASRNTERHRFTRPYVERRRIERQRQSDEAAAALDPRNLARALKFNPYVQQRP